MCVSLHETTALFGFFILLTVISQLFSGTMLSFSLVLESTLIAIDREEEEGDVLYIDDFFWLHERGVDLIFIFSYLHLFRKLYLGSYNIDQEVSWKSGVFTFLIFQGVTFFGLLLCCTHLSEITLTIAANIFHTFFLFYGETYWWFFTDKTLNTDTLIRLGYLHYISAFYMTYLAILHGLDLHYDWKNESTYDGVDFELVWWDEAFSNELGTFLEFCLLLNYVCWLLYPEPESLSYELFMWGDIGMVTDIRFYGVAPHWYFRPFMAWLIACPHHKTGIFGLLLFFFTLFHQPTLHGTRQEVSSSFLTLVKSTARGENSSFSLYINKEKSAVSATLYVAFVMSMLYTSSFLPYGRFYNRLGGNSAMLFSYLYVLFFLTFRGARINGVSNLLNFSFLQKIKITSKFSKFQKQ